MNLDRFFVVIYSPAGLRPAQQPLRHTAVGAFKVEDARAFANLERRSKEWGI